MSGECQVNVKSQSELDIGGRETCYYIVVQNKNYNKVLEAAQFTRIVVDLMQSLGNSHKKRFVMLSIN